MIPGSTPFTSVSAFLALVAIVLILVWLCLRQVSPREREELEGQIADLRRRLRAAHNKDSEEPWRSSSPHNQLAERIPGQRQDELLKLTKEELAFKQGELSKAWESNTNLKEKLASLGRELDAERKRGQGLSKQYEPQIKELGTRAQRDPTRSQMDDLRTENAQLKAQVRAAKKKFTEMKQNDSGMQNEDLIARNQYLQDELKAARKYGGMEDQYAGAEVVDMVEKLNSDILQVAATVAEGLDLDEWANDLPQSVDSLNGSNANNLATVIGRDLTRLLSISASQDLNIVLQMAFQASMTYHTMLITSSWCYGSSQEERLFDESYRSMQRDELQSVSGRWRQLAMAHLKDSKTAYEQYLMPRLVGTLADIVVAAGYKQDPAIVRKQITSRFANRLEEVIKSARDLHRIIGEEVTSCDLEVLWLRPGTSFDPSVMEDTFGPTIVHEEVACVTDVGLRGNEKISGLTQRKQKVLLKAKVLLPSGLAGIRVRDIEPPR